MKLACRPGLLGIAVCAMLALPVRAQNQGASSVETCSKKFGTITVVDPRTGVGHLQKFGLGSPAALLRMMIQQSGCFDVVERGVAMQNIQQERALAAGGQLREGSNIGQGQLQVADFVMTPDVQIPTSDTGGIAGALGGLTRLGGGLLGGLAGGLKFREATTSLLIADVRSSIQVAGAEGKASKTDFSIGGWGVGAGAGGALGGYTSSPEGKVVAASLLDNYNKIVLDIRGRDVLIKPTTAEATANAQGSTRAEAPVPAGQMLVPKIANVKVYAQPTRDSAVVGTLQRNEELVATGESKDGFVRVDGGNFSGWVQRTLVMPAAGGGAAAPAAAAPIATAAAPVPATLNMPAPRYRYGVFAGAIEGADTGRFRVLIDDDGDASGDGSFTRYGAFGLIGKYEVAKGQLVLQGNSSAGAVWFVGRYDPGRGMIVGSWNVGNAPGLMLTGNTTGGSFSAQRQP